MENLEQLREIADKAASKITKQDRSLIDTLSKEHGLTFNPASTTCGSCYKDQAVALYVLLKYKEQPSAPKQKYRLPVGIRINWGGHIITNDEMTDALAEVMIERGLGNLFENGDND